MMVKMPAVTLIGFFTGKLLTKTITNYWRNNINREIYIFGRRLHHGLIGLLLTIIGILLKIPMMIGIGFQLLIDDIDDWSEWINFEIGGNPDKIISYS